MNRVILATLTSHWRRAPGQLLTLVVGLALATALWTAVQAINSEARASFDEASASLTGAGTVRLEGPSPVPVATYAALRRAGWPVTPVIEGEIELGGQTFALVGIEPLTAAEGETRSDLSFGDGQLGTELLDEDGLLLVAPEEADLLAGTDGLPPVRASASVEAGRIVTDIATAARLLDIRDEVTAILLKLGAREGLRPVAEVAQGFRVPPPEVSGDMAQLTRSFRLNLTAFGFLSFAVGLLIVYAAVGLAFEQRRGMVRTLRGLGTPLPRLVGALIGEMFLLAALAGAAGVVVGYLVAEALLPGVASTLRGLYGAGVGESLTLRPSWVLSGLAMAMVGTMAATAQAVVRTARMPLLAAAKPRAWARVSLRERLGQVLLGAALLLTAAILPAVTSGLASSFALLGSLLLGAAILLPPALDLLLRAGERLVRGPLAEWSMADTRQQLPSLSLAMMALLLALAANIGVGTMVSSFRLTFVGWLDQRLASELYVSAGSEAQARELERWLAPRTETILPIASVEAEVAGEAVEVFGASDDPTYKDNWPLLRRTPDAWERLAAGEGILVNEQLWRKEGWRLGDRLDVAGGEPMTLIGVYSDYGNPKGQVMIGFEELERRFAERLNVLRFGLRLPPGEVDALKTALNETFDLPDGGILDQQAAKDLSLSIFERTFAITGALNVLTLGVAGFALFSSLTTLAGMRMPQLAPVWALGVTRRTLARLELAKALLLAALTFLFALPLGLLLAFVLLAVVNVEAFGWRLPLHLFPGAWLQLLFLALVAAAAASALPARRLARQPPRAFLQIFAQER